MVLNFICDRPAMINNGGAGVIRTLIPARGVRVTAGYRHQSLQLLQKLTKLGRSVRPRSGNYGFRDRHFAHLNYQPVTVFNSIG